LHLPVDRCPADSPVSDETKAERHVFEPVSLPANPTNKKKIHIKMNRIT